MKEILEEILFAMKRDREIKNISVSEFDLVLTEILMPIRNQNGSYYERATLSDLQRIYMIKYLKFV